MTHTMATASGQDAGEQTRLLRRITPLADWPTIKGAKASMKICVIDLETTGLDPQHDHILEFAAAIIEVDHEGRIVSVDGPHGAFNDPGRPIKKHICQLTGITDEMVRGKKLSESKLASFIGKAQCCLAHNANFDRQHLETLVPEVETMPWICAMADVPWRKLGFDGRAQGYLLMQSGLFNPVAHRATDDVESLVNLLSHHLMDGKTILAHALKGAQSDAWRFEATNAPFRFKDALRRRGYRFSYKKVWHKLVRPDDHDDEMRWYRDTLNDEPSVVLVGWRDRYRADWTWEPVKRQVEVAAWRR